MAHLYLRDLADMKYHQAYRINENAFVEDSVLAMAQANELINNILSANQEMSDYNKKINKQFDAMVLALLDIKIKSGTQNEISEIDDVLEIAMPGYKKLVLRGGE